MEFNVTKPTVKQKFVFSISRHPHLGVLVEPYVVDLTKTDEFSLSFRKVTLNTIADYGIVLSDEELEIISITDQYNDESIIRRFSKKAVLSTEFFKKLDEKQFQKVLRPFIEKKLDEILNLILRHKIPLYFKGLKKDPIHDTPVKIERKPAEVVFNFVKHEDKTKYYISVRHEEQGITLTNKNALLITNQPCWLFLENKIYRFTDEIDSKKLVPFFNKPHIDIPAKNEKKYFETFILKSIRNCRVHATGFQIREEKPPGKTLLKLESSWNEQPLLLLQFKYGNKKFYCHDESENNVSLKSENNEYAFFKIRRNKEWEKEQAEIIHQFGLVHYEGAAFTIPENKPDTPPAIARYNLLSWVNRNEKALQEKDITIIQDKESSNTYYTGAIKIDYKVDQVKDWFDVHIVVKFGEYEIPFSSLRNHILNHQREYQLPNGEIAIIPEEWFAEYEGILRFGKIMDDRLLVKNHHFAAIEQLKNKNGVQQKLKEFKKLYDTGKIDLIMPPENINAVLRPYQAEGLSWLYFLRQHHLGACLADDMGLGKTIQVLSLLLKIKNEATQCPLDITSHQSDEAVQLSLFGEKNLETHPPFTSLIVMPLSLVHNWENEIKKFAPDLKVFIHTGIKRVETTKDFHKYDVILTTYGIVRNDFDLLAEFDFHYIILDESQVIKNPESKIFKSIKELNSEHRIVMTGTPIENSLTDLWSQMTFLNDGLVGSINFFKKQFVSPIERFKDEQRQEDLKKLINPFIMRRTKANVAKDLPELTQHIYYCEMSDEQRKIYEEQKSSIRNLILDNIEKKGKEKSNFVILNGLMKLRLLANHPSLVNDEYHDESGKFNDVMHNIEKIISGNHKVLIFSSFVKHLNMFKKYLEASNINHHMLTGELSDKKRKAVIKEFQDQEDTRVFLISIKAGGVGLNLTSADYVFILDPWWNPAVENQAINRTHRIGQKKKIFSYKFITTDSIEEKILRLQQEKSKLSDELISESNLFKHFSEDEIKMLLN